MEQVKFTSSRNRQFNRMFDKLPQHAQETAEDTFKRWKKEPSYGGFKRLPSFSPLNIWSIGFTSMGTSYRAMARKDGNKLRWFWVGTHENYNKLYRAGGDSLRGVNESKFMALAESVIRSLS